MKQIVSIKKEENFLKLAIAEKKFNSFSIKHLEVIDLSQFNDSKNTSGLSLIENILNQQAIWLLGLSSSEYLEKNLIFPSLSWSKIKKLIPFQLESLFPYELNDFHLKQVLSKKSKEKEVSFFLVSKSKLEEKIKSLLDNRLEPDFILFDHLGIREILKEKVFKFSGLYLHMNLYGTVIVLFESHSIKQLINIDLGYQSLKESGFSIRGTTLHNELNRIFNLIRKRESDLAFCTGFFDQIKDLKDLFPNVQFVYQESKNNLFALEIANIRAYFRSKKDSLDIDFMKLPRKEKEVKKSYSFIKKVVMASLFMTTTFFLGIQKFSEIKIPKTIGLESLFIHQNLRSTYQIIRQLAHQSQDIPLVLDLSYQPMSTLEILNILSKPLSENDLRLKKMNHQILKYPSFKEPHLTYAQKIELLVDGQEKNIDELCKDLKKIRNIDTRKGFKIEKGKNESKLEFFIR